VSDSHLIFASNRRRVLCAVASFLTIVFPLLHASDASSAEDDGLQVVGLVEAAGGEAFAEIKEKRRMLEPASPIYLNDQVGTGSDSRIALRLGEHTKIQLGERARLKIDRFLLNTGGDITLDTGAMLFEKRDGRPMPFSVRTAYGVIDVRGTRFFAGPSNNVFGVFVDEGSVTVTAGGRRVTLRAGEGTDISKPGARPTAPKRWGQPRIKAAYASVQ
jgi:ferric-dicitrate binding protein FerR (iron transport regulator)